MTEDQIQENYLWCVNNHYNEIHALELEPTVKGRLFRGAVIDACCFEFREVSSSDLNAGSLFYVSKGLTFDEVMKKLN